MGPRGPDGPKGGAGAKVTSLFIFRNTHFILLID